MQLLEGIGEGKIGMDCSIVPLRHGLFMVSTTDFFFPLVDDPYLQGRIGACNVLSDMYAMGVHQIDNVLMILAASKHMEIAERDIVTRKLIEGFNDTCKEAGVDCTGGQTVINPWPMIGGTAMSACAKGEFIEPVSAVIGDVLVLTKPLGTQIAVNLNEWRQLPDQTKWNKALEVITFQEACYAFEAAHESMARLNKEGAILMHKYSAHACTDVTGFGILGHASNLVGNQHARLDFEITALPIIAKMVEVAAHVPPFKLLQGLSPETSGGLLIALPPENTESFLSEIEAKTGKKAWIVGRVVPAQSTDKNQARIIENPTIIPV